MAAIVISVRIGVQGNYTARALHTFGTFSQYSAQTETWKIEQITKFWQ
jgi:hypothetical protein